MSIDKYMKTIGVFFGGKNPEHDVSIITGQLVISGLKKLGYPVVPVFIGQDGTWYTGDALGELKFFTNETRNLKGLDELSLNLKKSHGKMVLKKGGVFGGTITIDIAFPALHGQYGEDGTIQGLFEMLDIPYVGCSVVASANAMDKALTKYLYVALGIPTTDFVWFRANEWARNRGQILSYVERSLPTYPLFVKPARLGSSIGITKAKDSRELENAIEVAMHYDSKVIVEKAVENVMDVTCAVLGHDTLKASLLQESSFATDFLTYDDKYLKEGGTQLGGAKKSVVIPAQISESLSEEISSAAKSIYERLELSGTARIDFLYDGVSGKYYANEINTMPGTLYHHLWKKSGIELPELLTSLIESAESKHKENESVTRMFKSKLMDLAKSAKLRIKGS